MLTLYLLKLDPISFDSALSAKESSTLDRTWEFRETKLFFTLHVLSLFHLSFETRTRAEDNSHQSEQEQETLKEAVDLSDSRGSATKSERDDAKTS